MRAPLIGVSSGSRFGFVCAIDSSFELELQGRAFLRKPGGIARHQIDFEIDLRAGLDRLPVGNSKRVRNDEYAEFLALDLVHGERNAVKRNRAFRGDETRQRL